MNKKILKTAIITAWVMLLSCFIFKIFGSQVFEIIAVNDRFAVICTWLDTKGKIVKYVIAFCLTICSNTLILLASSNKKIVSKGLFLIFETVIIIVWALKLFNTKIGLIAEFIMFVTLPAIVSKKWYRGIVGYALMFVFQILSLYIRGEEIKVFDDSTVLALIMSIDYYIMIVLFYLYTIYANKITKKEN